MDKKKVQEHKNMETFSKRRMIVNVLLYLALFCFAFIFTSRFIQNVSLTGMGNATEVGIAMGVITGAVIGIFVYWRCPNCKKFIGVKPKPTECPNCKAKLVEAKKK